MKHEERERLAQEILEMLFDCHPEPEALRARIAADPELQALQQEVEQQAQALRDAARVEGTRVELVVPARAPRRGLWRRPWGRVLLVAGVALVASLAGVLHWQWREMQLREFQRANLMVQVAAPRSVPAAAVATLVVSTHSLGGEPLSCPVQWRTLRGDGSVTGQGQAQTHAGSGTIQLPASFEALERVEVTAEGPSGVRTVTVPLRRGDAPPLVHLATDRPIYRPGETVLLRAVVLDRLTLTPRAERLWVSATVKDSRGSVVHQLGAAALDDQASVHRTCWEVPANQPGGTYTWEVMDGRGGGPVEKLEFLVRDFQAPKLRKTVTLDRTTYAPGERGAVELQVERMAGGSAAGATVEASLLVDGTQVWQDGAPLDARGRATFTFRVPETVAKGAARFVARVTDGSVVETEVKPFVVPTGVVNAAFSPEGGDLVAGLRSRVYVELTDPLGRPVSGRGVVVEDGGSVVAEFATAHEGRGRFELTPVAGKSYQLELAEPAGRGFALPKVVAAGVVVRTVEDGVPAGEPVRVLAQSVPARPLHVRVFCRGVQVGHAEVPAGSGGEVAVGVPAEIVGVLRVTVFDDKLAPLAERLVQRLPKQQVALTLTPERAVLAPGASQRVRVQTRDERGAPVAAVVGLCVTDRAVEDLGTKPRVGIVDQAQLLADSVPGEDVKTFLAAHKDAARNADLLLGTQGWRRFVWREDAAKVASDPRRAEAQLKDGPGPAAQHRPRLTVSGVSPQQAVWQARELAEGLGGIGIALLLLWSIGEACAWLGRRGSKEPVSAGRQVLLAGVCAVVVGLVLLLFQPLTVGTVRFSALAPGAELEDITLGLDPSSIRGLPNLGRGDIEGHPAAGVFFNDGGDAEIRARTENYFTRVTVSDVADFRLPPDLGSIGYVSDFSVEVAQGSVVTDPQVDDIQNGLMSGRASRRAPPCVREYHHKHTAHDGRSDFAQTVCWQPLLVTDAQGEASVSFDVSDLVTTWQVHADAHAPGRVGQATTTFDARQPFHLEAKLPVEVTQGDDLLLPVAVSAESLPSAEVRLSARGIASAADGASQTVALKDSRGRALFPVAIRETQGSAELVLSGTAGRFTDLVRQNLRIVPRGFRHARAWGGVLSPGSAFTLAMPDQPVPGSAKARLKVFPSPVALLGEGLEGLLQEPHGCFEQASSTNYPNLLTLSYVQASGDNLPGVVARARAVLPKGYQLLTGYECKQRGYEWFGADPGHEALTAYGLMEFTDMAKVFPVDRAMVDRTRTWLLGRRDGQGGFKSGGQGHSFGRTSADASSAYVLYALLESGEAAESLRAELDRAAQRAANTADSYELALCACALGKAQRGEAAAARQRLYRVQSADGGLTGAVTSITSSGGDDLRVETTGFAILAWLADPAHAEAVRKGIEFLHGKQQGRGTFGATQATIVALRAITAYAQDQRVTPAPGTLQVWVGDAVVARRDFAAGEREPIVFDLLPHLKSGDNAVRVELTGGGRAMPFACDLEYHADLPADDPECVLDLRAELGAKTVEEGRTVGLHATVTNRTDKTQPMTVAVLGLPAGLEAPTTVLEDLKKSGAVDFWELRGRELCFYWRGLSANERKEVQLDLLARIPGTSAGPAARTWLYYTPQSKRWAAPLLVQVTPAR